MSTHALMFAQQEAPEHAGMAAELRRREHRRERPMTAYARVLDAIEAEPHTTAWLARATGIEMGPLEELLNTMARRGLIRQEEGALPNEYFYARR